MRELLQRQDLKRVLVLCLKALTDRWRREMWECYTRVSIRVTDIGSARTGNLQQYLFKILQEQDAAARLTLEIDVQNASGTLEKTSLDRIIEGMEQPKWEPH